MTNNSSDMLKIAYKALNDKKGLDIKVLDIRNVTVIADYFIIAHGSNKIHVQALTNYVEDELEKNGYFAKQKEGYNSASWILLDYNNIIIHIFSEEDRLFYDLERIWSDGKQLKMED